MVLIILLFLMVTPGFIIDVQNEIFWGTVKTRNLTLFIILLCLTAIPWIAFDNWFRKIRTITLSEKGVILLKKVFNVVIVACLFSYIYVFPYAIRSYSIGAIEIRDNLRDLSVLPESIFTTISVAIGLLSPFYVFFFFLSFLDERLKKYTIWLFFCSFIYIVVSMPFMARDGFIVLPIMYAIMYLIFKESMSPKSKKKIAGYFVIVVGVALGLLTVYTLSRFYIKTTSGFDSTRLVSGSWGYLFQQPYVFDRTIEHQHYWHGVGLRFPILSVFSNSPAREVVRTQDFETMFGTMLSEFYSIGGYWSLFVFTFSFIIIYYVGLKMNIRRNNYFSVFMFFITYLMLEVTGLFYFRYGGISNNYLFLLLTIMPLFLPKNIIILNKSI